MTPWRDHAVAPHIGGHESPGGPFRPGLMGMMAAGPFGFGEGYGAFGPYWAFRALGTGMNAREQHPMTPRPDVTRSGRTGSPPCSRTSPQIVIPEILTEEYEPRG